MKHHRRLIVGVTAIICTILSGVAMVVMSALAASASYATEVIRDPMFNSKIPYATEGYLDRVGDFICQQQFEGKRAVRVEAERRLIAANPPKYVVVVFDTYVIRTGTKGVPRMVVAEVECE